VLYAGHTYLSIAPEGDWTRTEYFGKRWKPTAIRRELNQYAAPNLNPDTMKLVDRSLTRLQRLQSGFYRWSQSVQENRMSEKTTIILALSMAWLFWFLFFLYLGV